MSLKERFEQWKKGKFIPKDPDQPETLGGLGVIREGKWVQPWPIRKYKSIKIFISADWKQNMLVLSAIVTAIAAIVGAYAAIGKQPEPKAVFPSKPDQGSGGAKPGYPGENNRQNNKPRHKPPNPKENVT